MNDIREAIFTHFINMVNKECTMLCKSATSPTHFRNIPVDQMVNFKWENLVDELKLNAPLLFKILVTIASRNDHRNVYKVGSAHYPGICTAVAIMLKERNRYMCGVQSLVSLIMYSCHCEKVVCIHTLTMISIVHAYACIHV